MPIPQTSPRQYKYTHFYREKHLFPMKQLFTSKIILHNSQMVLHPLNAKPRVLKGTYLLKIWLIFFSAYPTVH